MAETANSQLIDTSTSINTTTDGVLNVVSGSRLPLLAPKPTTVTHVGYNSSITPLAFLTGDVISNAHLDENYLASGDSSCRSDQEETSSVCSTLSSDLSQPETPNNSDDGQGGQVVEGPSVSVPFGWKRLLEGSLVTYISPSKCRLFSLQQVFDYLQTEGTCKCGLQCPLVVAKVFNFNAGVTSRPWSHEEGTDSRSLAKLCNHERKLLALATLHHSAILSKNDKKINQDNNNCKSKQMKNHLSGGIYDRVLVSQLLAEREKVSWVEEDELKPLPGKESNIINNNNINSNKHNIVVGPQNSVMTICNNGNLLTTDVATLQQQIQNPLQQQQVWSKNNNTNSNANNNNGGQRTITLHQVQQLHNLQQQLLNRNKKVDNNNVAFLGTEQELVRTIQNDCNVAAVNHCDMTGAFGIPVRTALPTIPTAVNMAGTVVYRPTPPLVLPAVSTETWSDATSKQKVMKKSLSKSRTRTKYGGSLLDRSSPCPNIDVRQIPVEHNNNNRPPTLATTDNLPIASTTSIPSFLDDPNAYLARQTALLNDTISRQKTPPTTGIVVNQSTNIAGLQATLLASRNLGSVQQFIRGKTNCPTQLQTLPTLLTMPSSRLPVSSATLTPRPVNSSLIRGNICANNGGVALSRIASCNTTNTVINQPVIMSIANHNGDIQATYVQNIDVQKSIVAQQQQQQQLVNVATNQLYNNLNAGVRPNYFIQQTGCNTNQLVASNNGIAFQQTSLANVQQQAQPATIVQHNITNNGIPGILLQQVLNQQQQQQQQQQQRNCGEFPASSLLSAAARAQLTGNNGNNQQQQIMMMQNQIRLPEMMNVVSPTFNAPQTILGSPQTCMISDNGLRQTTAMLSNGQSIVLQGNLGQQFNSRAISQTTLTNPATIRPQQMMIPGGGLINNIVHGGAGTLTAQNFNGLDRNILQSTAAGCSFASAGGSLLVTGPAIQKAPSPLEAAVMGSLDGQTVLLKEHGRTQPTVKLLNSGCGNEFRKATIAPSSPYGHNEMSEQMIGSVHHHQSMNNELKSPLMVKSTVMTSPAVQGQFFMSNNGQLLVCGQTPNATGMAVTNLPSGIAQVANAPMPPLTIPNVTTVTTTMTQVIPAVGVAPQILGQPVQPIMQLVNTFAVNTVQNPLLIQNSPVSSATGILPQTLTLDSFSHGFSSASGGMTTLGPNVMASLLGQQTEDTKINIHHIDGNCSTPGTNSTCSTPLSNASSTPGPQSESPQSSIAVGKKKPTCKTKRRTGTQTVASMLQLGNQPSPMFVPGVPTASPFLQTVAIMPGNKMSPQQPVINYQGMNQLGQQLFTTAQSPATGSSATAPINLAVQPTLNLIGHPGTFVQNIPIPQLVSNPQTAATIAVLPSMPIVNALGDHHSAGGLTESTTNSALQLQAARNMMNLTTKSSTIASNSNIFCQDPGKQCSQINNSGNSSGNNNNNCQSGNSCQTGNTSLDAIYNAVVGAASSGLPILITNGDSAAERREELMTVSSVANIVTNSICDQTPTSSNCYQSQAFSETMAAMATTTTKPTTTITSTPSTSAKVNQASDIVSLVASAFHEIEIMPQDISDEIVDDSSGKATSVDEPMSSSAISGDRMCEVSSICSPSTSTSLTTSGSSSVSADDSGSDRFSDSGPALPGSTSVLDLSITSSTAEMAAVVSDAHERRTSRGGVCSLSDESQQAPHSTVAETSLVVVCQADSVCPRASGGRESGSGGCVVNFDDDDDDDEEEEYDMSIKMELEQVLSHLQDQPLVSFETMRGKKEGIKRRRREISPWDSLLQSDESSASPPPSSEPRSFNIGDLVWGQIRGFPSWPGKLVEEEEVRGHHVKSESGKLWVRWFGDHTFTQVEPEKLKTLTEGLEAHHRARKKYRKGRKMNSQLENAIQEAMMELDKQAEVTSQTEEPLFASSKMSSTSFGKTQPKPRPSKRRKLR